MVHLKWWVIGLLLFQCVQSASSLNLRPKKKFEAAFTEVHPDAFQQTSPTSLPSLPIDNPFNIASVVREGLSGAFAGSIQVVFLMWLRTTMSYQHKYGLSLQSTIRELYKSGGIRRFYKGVGFAMIQAPVAKFFSVASNDCTIFLSNKWKSDSTTLQLMLFTALGGILSAFFRAMMMPLDTCKTVLQVDGSVGFQRLLEKVRRGNFWVLYQGTLATIAATFIGHYPWYSVHNYLQRVIATPSALQLKILKNAFIAFVATAVSDIFSNSVRVVKTVKQTSNQLTYTGAIQNILSNDGYKGLFGRGMLTRLISNSIQSIFFTVIWKLTSLRHQ